MLSKRNDNRSKVLVNHPKLRSKQLASWRRDGVQQLKLIKKLISV